MVPSASAAARSGPAADATCTHILVVDDSAVARAVIGRAIESDPRFRVVGSVPHAAAALGFLQGNRVDAVVLDIEMPGVNGLAALPSLIAHGRGAKVLIVSSSAGEGASATIEALALGAADTLVKPAPGGFSSRFSTELVEKLGRLCTAEPLAEAIRPAPRGTTVSGFDVVAIGASTGGIHALKLILTELPASFTLPILITQHLPESFMPYFAAQVAILARRPCAVAEDRMRVRPGHVIVAPGDAHMRLVSAGGGAAIRLVKTRATSGCMPSVDPMLESLAEVYGARALAIVLSGMGRDGKDGAGDVARAGGVVLVQDRESSVVWGMPGAVAASGSAHAVLPPAEIARLIVAGRRPS